MEQLVFLDTNLVYDLSFIEALKDKYNYTYKEIADILLYEKYRDTEDKKKCAMTGNPKAVVSLVQLYRDIEEGKICPCICPVVCSEIMNDNSGKLRDANTNPFTQMMLEYINKNCTVYMPSKEYKNDFISHTYDFQEKLKDNSVEIDKTFYGLNDEEGHKDFNDRAMLAQLSIISRYTDEKLNFVNYGKIDEKTKKYLNEIHGKLVNKKSNNGVKYNMYSGTKKIKFYHFNHRDMGSRVKERHFTEEAHEKSTELENGIEKQLQINVQQIAEYEK